MIEEFILRNGIYTYPLVFLWTALEGETVVLFAGYLASRGLINLPLLITVAWLGSFTGDQIYFYLGRRYGVRLLARFPRWRSSVDRALGLLERYSTAFILSFRFIYGVRNFSSLAIGMSPLSWNRFWTLNFVAAGLWSVSFAGAGWLFGAAFKNMLGEAAFIFGLVMLVAFCVAAWTLGRRNRRRNAKSTQAKENAEV